MKNVRMAVAVAAIRQLDLRTPEDPAVELMKRIEALAPGAVARAAAALQLEAVGRCVGRASAH